MKKAMISRTAVLVIGAATILSLCGCGGGQNSTNAPASNTTGQNQSTAAPVTPTQENSNIQIGSPPNSNQSSNTQAKVALTSNLYFVFDGSGSMHNRPKASTSTSDKTKIVGAKWAVHEFLKNVPENVNLGLYVFDGSGSRQVLPLGPGNREQFLQAIDSITARGATPLGVSIRTGADALQAQYEKQLGYGEFKLIVITDGDSTDQLAPGVNEAARYKIPIYTIGFDMGNDHALRRHSVAYRAADSEVEVEKGLEEAVAELDVFDAPTFKKSVSK